MRRTRCAGGSSANTFAGIAISSYAVDASKGAWQYSIDNGANWIALVSAGTTSAITLNASDLLRFVPAANYNGPATTMNANLIESGGPAIVSGATLNLSGATGGATHISSATVALSETINAVNDAPTISGVTSATVHEDDPFDARSVSNQLTGTDPDAGDSVQLWTVQGGTTPQPGQYSFKIDEFKLSRPGNVTLFDDTFADGVPPPNAPSPPNYLTNGSFTETTANGGQVVMDSAHAVSIAGVGTSTPLIGQFATLPTDISGNTTLGLKLENDFTVEGTFDLTSPADLRDAYGIALTDATAGQPGNDKFEILVSKGSSGVFGVQLRDLDPSANVNKILDAFSLDSLNLLPQENQITLRLTHVANSSTITASFDILASGVQTRPTITFNTTDNLFNGEDWTHAQFFADAPSPTVSYLSGTYGTLSIDSNGLWTYTLNNALQAVQALGQNDTAQDIFTVNADDGHGGIGQKTITINVQGKNDPPTITGDMGLTVVKGGSAALTTLDLQAADPDNTPDAVIFTALGWFSNARPSGA